jgi:hypothetical protein
MKQKSTNIALKIRFALQAAMLQSQTPSRLTICAGHVLLLQTLRTPYGIEQIEIS